MNILLNEIATKVFNAFRAYNALNKQNLNIVLPSKIENKPINFNSLLIGSTKKHCEFLPSKTWQWFSSIN